MTIFPTSADPVAIARDLITCPSVTPEEGGAIAYLARLLSRAGFDCHRVTFSEPGTADVVNFFATIGTAGPHLAFAGHTDVVPPGDPAHWTHGPFDGKIADDMLWGRGAVDMKGGIACFVAAALRHIERHGPTRGRISFLITGDEEGPAVNGTLKLMKWAHERGERFDACVVGEPTNPAAIGDAIKVGRRGSLSGTITVYGKQGHVAYPHLAQNPIRTLTRLVDALMRTPLDHGNERFDQSNLEVISVDVGNSTWNVIPAEARARFNIRFNDQWTRATLEEELKARLAAAATPDDARHVLTLETTSSESFLTRSPDLIDALSDAVEAETGRRPDLSTSGGTSDARFIKDYCPVVEFGLVGKTMHQVDERVALSDLVLLERIYERFMARFFQVAA
jgi:succinyl-diaminopimelate desuccinylase